MSYSLSFSQSLEILFYIELKTKIEDEHYLTIQQISNKLNIPIPSIKRLVGILKRGNFIDSKKGVNGGLALTRMPKDINVYDVFKAVEGKTSLFKQYDNFDTNSFVHKDEVKFMLAQSEKLFFNIEASMHMELKKMTLADFFES